MAKPNKILVVGGDAELVETVQTRLAARGHGVDVATSSAEAYALFQGSGAELVIACLPLPDGGGGDLLRGLRAIDARVSVVVTGADDQIRSAADAFKLDAVDHVEDAARDMNDVLAAVGSALGSRRGDAQLRYLKQREATGASWSALVGRSPAMREVVETLQRVCERTTKGAPPTILIRGETGTGKGLLAKCLHYNGVRRNHAFVEINCAAIPGQLLESELFGYERGAFTDAKTSRVGLFETGHLGTLFLDEIGSLAIDLQAKLLTAIEEKKIRRLGGRQSIQVDVQIIAASHGDLTERVKAGVFRSDLYHRLNVVSVTLPPLRDRGADKLVLARSFIDATCREYGISPREIGADAEEYILGYAWPGNVRELRNQIERVLLLGEDGLIGRGHFAKPSLPPPRVAGTTPGFSMTLPEEGIGLEEVERELITRALQRFDGNVSQAARFLRISRQTLIYRIKKHGIESSR